MHFIGKCTPTFTKLGLYAINGASAIKVKIYSGAFLNFFLLSRSGTIVQNFRKGAKFCTWMGSPIFKTDALNCDHNYNSRQIAITQCLQQF